MLHPPLKTNILFCNNGLALWHGLPNIGHVEVNNGREADILNLIKSKFVTVHPPLKPHILLYSNGLAILYGFCDILQCGS